MSVIKISNHLTNDTSMSWPNQIISVIKRHTKSIQQYNYQKATSKISTFQDCTNSGLWPGSQETSTQSYDFVYKTHTHTKLLLPS